MKMDMNLIRELLIYFEQNLNGGDYELASTITIPKYTSEQILYHVPLLIDGGYIDYKDLSRGAIRDFWITRLTLEGHQFLGLIRDNRTWGILKTVLKDTLVALPLLAPYIAPLVPKLLGIP
jgi:hypothetical protein